MATPLLLQALELNTIIWKNGPYVRFPLKWNSVECKFSGERSHNRKLVWLFATTVPYEFAVLGLTFLVTVALKEPYLDKIEHWIGSFEVLPIVTYVFLYSWKIYHIGPVNFCAYHNFLIRMSRQNKLVKFKLSSNQSKGILRFITPLIEGTIYNTCRKAILKNSKKKFKTNLIS